MPPKVTDTRPTPEALHAVEEETAASARRIVATYAQDFLDGVTLMCKKTTKKTTKKATKKTTKKTVKKA